MPDHGRIAKADRALPSTTGRVLATATNFHDVRFFSFPAILATVFAAFFVRAIARAVRTLASFFSHRDLLNSSKLREYSIVGECRALMLRRAAGKVKKNSLVTIDDLGGARAIRAASSIVRQRAGAFRLSCRSRSVLAARPALDCCRNSSRARTRPQYRESDAA